MKDHIEDIRNQLAILKAREKQMKLKLIENEQLYLSIEIILRELEAQGY